MKQLSRWLAHSVRLGIVSPNTLSSVVRDRGGGVNQLIEFIRATIDSELETKEEGWERVVESLELVLTEALLNQ